MLSDIPDYYRPKRYNYIAIRTLGRGALDSPRGECKSVCFAGLSIPSGTKICTEFLSKSFSFRNDKIITDISPKIFSSNNDFFQKASQPKADKYTLPYIIIRTGKTKMPLAGNDIQEHINSIVNYPHTKVDEIQTCYTIASSTSLCTNTTNKNCHLTNSLNDYSHNTKFMAQKNSSQKMEKERCINNDDRYEVNRNMATKKNVMNVKKAKEEISNRQNMSQTNISEDDLNDEKINEEKWKQNNDKNMIKKNCCNNKMNEERRNEKKNEKKVKENKLNANETGEKIVNDVIINDELIDENKFKKEPMVRKKSVEEKTNENKRNDEKVNGKKLSDRKMNAEKEVENKMNEEVEDEKRISEEKEDKNKIDQDKIDDAKMRGKKVIEHKLNELKINDTIDMKQMTEGNIVDDKKNEKKMTDEEENENKRDENKMNENSINKLAEHEKNLNEKRINKETTNEKNIQNNKVNEESEVGEEKNNEKKVIEITQNEQQNNEKILNETNEKIKDMKYIATKLNLKNDNEDFKNEQEMSGKKINQPKINEPEINETIDVKEMNKECMAEDKRNDEEMNHERENENKINENKMNKEKIYELSGLEQKIYEVRANKEETKKENVKKNNVNEDNEVIEEKTNDKIKTEQKRARKEVNEENNKNEHNVLQIADDVSDLPENWSKNVSPVRMISLHQYSDEFSEVASSFYLTMNNVTIKIIRIERIENPAFYRGYQEKKNELVNTCLQQECERKLWHGTTADKVSSINSKGFSRSYSSSSTGAVYGNGAYFAVDATMSAKYSNPDASGFRYMYRCKVLTGDYTVGRNGLNEAPIRDINTQSWYHSVVDDVISPSMFVTFNDYQAYPEYLIIFN